MSDFELQERSSGKFRADSTTLRTLIGRSPRVKEPAGRKIVAAVATAISGVAAAFGGSRALRARRLG